MKDLMNKCPIEIKQLAKTMSDDDVRQMIRFYFSRHLMDTSEDNQIVVDIKINDIFSIVSIWQEPCEGIIKFVLSGGHEIEFDDVNTSALFKIMTYFGDYYTDEF